MDNTEKAIYEKIKQEYNRFKETKRETNKITKHLTELNYINKLEEIAKRNNFKEEFSYLYEQKQIVLKFLKDTGIEPKI